MLGAAVGISEDMAVIGARGKDRTANAGKAFVVKRSSGAWSEIAELSVSTGGASGVDSVYHLGERVVINSNAIDHRSQRARVKCYLKLNLEHLGRGIRVCASVERLERHIDAE